MRFPGAKIVHVADDFRAGQPNANHRHAIFESEQRSWKSVLNLD